MSATSHKAWFKVTPLVGTFVLVAAACTQAASPTATSVAPTAQAVQTQLAPTVQAVATSVAPAIATASRAKPVRVTNVNVQNQDTTITVQNVSSEAANLSNWTLHVGAASTQLPSGVDLQPGQSVTLHTASGTSSGANVFLGQSAQAIASEARPGAQVTLQNSAGSPVSSFVVPGA
jgi:Lamin Tail Domain